MRLHACRADSVVAGHLTGTDVPRRSAMALKVGTLMPRSVPTAGTRTGLVYFVLHIVRDGQVVQRASLDLWDTIGDFLSLPAIQRAYGDDIMVAHPLPYEPRGRVLGVGGRETMGVRLLCTAPFGAYVQYFGANMVGTVSVHRSPHSAFRTRSVIRPEFGEALRMFLRTDNSQEAGTVPVGPLAEDMVYFRSKRGSLYLVQRTDLMDSLRRATQGTTGAITAGVSRADASNLLAQTEAAPRDSSRPIVAGYLRVPPAQALMDTTARAMMRRQPARYSRFPHRSPALTERDEQGRTLLELAVDFGWERDVESLLALGTPDLPPVAGRERPLITALMWPRLDIARLLLQAGFSADVRSSEGLVAIEVARRAAGPEGVSLFVQLNVGLNARDAGGITPLVAAIQARDNNAVLALLAANDAGDNVDIHAEVAGATPLWHAIVWDATDIVYTLLRRGADVNAVNSQGYTPTDTALRAHNAGMASILSVFGGQTSQELGLPGDVEGEGATAAEEEAEAVAEEHAMPADVASPRDEDEAPSGEMAIDAEESEEEEPARGTVVVYTSAGPRVVPQTEVTVPGDYGYEWDPIVAGSGDYETFAAERLAEERETASLAGGPRAPRGADWEPIAPAAAPRAIVPARPIPRRPSAAEAAADADLAGLLYDLYEWQEPLVYPENDASPSGRNLACNEV